MPVVSFLNIAQWHQALHVLPIAAALSRRRDMEVRVALTTRAAVAQARGLTERLGAGPITFRAMWPEALAGLARLRGHPPKRLMLLGAAPWLQSSDAIVAPERTSLALRRMGVRRPMLVHCDHGAGDRAVGYEPRLRDFDYVLMAGAKQEARMLRDGLVRPGACRIVGYPKFEAAEASRAQAGPLFPTVRPTVLYNPHFDAELGSWDRFGAQVLAAFAAQDRYNLIFAPHVRLGQRVKRLAELVAPYAGRPNIHVDLGGSRSCDMTYTLAADIYLGDVSSQVYEFIVRPRPCLFLDANGRLDPQDENAAHAALGPVLETATGLIQAIDVAVGLFPLYRLRQVRSFQNTFDLQARSCSERAAEAVAEVALAAAARRAPRRGAGLAGPAAVTEPASS